MENNKKDYLFRIGPMIFFPKDAEPTPPAYQDSFEGYRNIIRLAIIVFYGIISFFLFGSLLEKEPIFENFGDRKTSFYVVFFIPLTVSLIDVYLVWLEKKTGIPMKPISKYMIYGSWLVSVVYYSTIVFNHL